MWKVKIPLVVEPEREEEEVVTPGEGLPPSEGLSVVPQIEVDRRECVHGWWLPLIPALVVEREVTQHRWHHP